MSIASRDIRANLMAHDAEYQRLAREHFRYESELEALSHSPYLSSDDLVLWTELKKRKLRVKDEMERLVALREREAKRC